MIRTYSEMIRLPSFKQRYEYLRLADGDKNRFGHHRWLNQTFYNGIEWEEVRRAIILRDSGFDLASEDRPIHGRITVHHINALSVKDFETRSNALTDPENLISCSLLTHKAIHHGTFDAIDFQFVERKPGDTCPWR